LSSACLMVTQRIDIMYMMVCSIFYVQNDPRDNTGAARLLHTALRSFVCRDGQYPSAVGVIRYRVYCSLSLSTADSKHRILHIQQNHLKTFQFRFLLLPNNALGMHLFSLYPCLHPNPSKYDRGPEPLAESKSMVIHDHGKNHGK